MERLCWCVIVFTTLFGYFGVQSRIAIDVDTLKDGQNNITSNIDTNKRAIVDIIPKQIDTKINDIENEESQINTVSLIKNYTIITDEISNEIDNTTIKKNGEDTAEIENTKVDNETALILTKFLEEGNVAKARSMSKVNPEHFLGVESYSGFFTVNKTYNSNIFFWYFPALGRPVNETPWILWMQGGPGASSLSGLFDEIGPFRVFNNTLRSHPFTWLKDHSLLFIDNPVGTGYSFTNSLDGFATNLETYSAHLYSTVSQFLQVFPELRTAPLYVAGESYAGKYVPALGMEIHKHKVNGKLDVNLQGFIVGNGYMDPAMIRDLTLPMKFFGLLQQPEIDRIKPLLEGFQRDIDNNDSIQAKNKWMWLISLLVSMTHQKHNFNFLRDDLPIGAFVGYLKEPQVKKALHVGDIKFSMINVTANFRLAPDFLRKTTPLFEQLLENYRVLAYCGQLDLMVPCVYSSQNYATWNWSNSSQFRLASRYPYMFRGKLSGYHKSGGNLTEVVVRGAGHLAAMEAPAMTLDMVTRFTTQRSMPSYYTDAVMNVIIDNHISKGLSPPEWFL